VFFFVVVVFFVFYFLCVESNLLESSGEMEPRCFKLLATLAPAEKFNMQIYRTLSSFIHPPLYFSDEQPSSKFNTHISNNSSSSNNNVNININHSNQNEKKNV